VGLLAKLGCVGREARGASESSLGSNSEVGVLSTGCVEGVCAVTTKQIRRSEAAGKV